MNKNKVSRVVWGLVIVLLLPALTTDYGVVGSGFTVDDLRAYIGDAVNLVDTTVLIESNVSDETVGNASNTYRDTDRLGHLKADLKGYESQIERRMNESSDTFAIVALMTNARLLKENIEGMELSLRAVTNNSERATKINEGVERIIRTSNLVIDGDELDRNSIASPFFNIGFFGDFYFKPVNGPLRLITPYGYRKNDNGEFGNKHLGIDLLANEGAEINPMFNGIISDIEKDIYGDNYTVTLFHGNGLYTVYHHVEMLSGFTRGKQVSYTDVIALAVNTIEYEEDKDNHIMLQVVLDGNYINPLYLFGPTGERIFKNWESRTTEVYAVDSNEFFYYVEEMSVENVNRDLEPNVIYDNQAVVVHEGYERPNPGLLNNIQEELEAN